MKITNALTIDVEDYFQVSAFERQIDRERWPTFESRVVKNTERILELLDQHQTRATFFVLGWTAERFPELVRAIHDAGHELGSHSYWHRLVYNLTPQSFRDDLQASCEAIQNVTGQAVTCYRAPSFSITKRSLWALEILVEAGITVDSSIFPIVHDRYGIPDAPQRIHRRSTPAGQLWEFPPTVVRGGGWNLPVSGGGYFRLYPWPLSRYCLARVNAKQQPFMFYFHPWEIDPQQPRLAAGSRLTRFRHYVNLASTYEKLRQLLTTFQFGRMGDVVQRYAACAESA